MVFDGGGAEEDPEVGGCAGASVPCTEVLL